MKTINENAPVKCSSTIFIKTSPENVWKVLTTIDAWPGWQKEIVHSKLHGKLTSGSSFKWKSGGVVINSTLHTVEPYSYFGWSGRSFGMFAVHNWELEVVNNETCVTVSESMEGLLAGIFKKSLNKSLKKGMNNWLNFLKKESERSL